MSLDETMTSNDVLIALVAVANKIVDRESYKQMICNRNIMDTLISLVKKTCNYVLTALVIVVSGIGKPPSI